MFPHKNSLEPLSQLAWIVYIIFNDQTFLQSLTLTANGTTTTAVTASKLSGGTVNAAMTAGSSNLRMVGGTGLNIAHIGGKPVLLASKQQSLQGQVCMCYMSKSY